MSRSYLTQSLESFIEIWGTITWVFVSAYVLLHLICAIHAFRVMRNQGIKIPIYYIVLLPIGSVFVGTFTAGVIAMPLAGTFVIIKTSIQVWLAVIFSGGLFVTYLLLTFNTLYVF